MAGAENGSKAGMADDGLGVTATEKKERIEKTDDGQGEVDNGNSEPVWGKNDMNENGKRRYDGGKDMNDGQRRESRRVG